MTANAAAGQPRLGNGTFTFGRHDEAPAGLVAAVPANLEDRLGIPEGERLGLRFAGYGRLGEDRTVCWVTEDGRTEVTEWSGIVMFHQDEELHRDGGPALIHNDGREDWYHHGTRIPAGTRDPEDILGVPDGERIGLHYAGVRHEGGEQVQVWSSGNGSYEVHVGEEGSIAFYLDGDLHRHGGPAVVLPDGTADWYRHGTLIEAARPTPPVKELLHAGPVDTHRISGDRYVDGRRTAAIAQEVRADLRDLDSVGFFSDGATVLVSSAQASTKSVNVRVRGLPKGEYIVDGNFTEKGRQLHDHLTDVLNQYNQYEVGPQASTNRRAFWEEVHLVEGP
ncbi:hypothetical protein [Curtobacterium sp. MCBD17_040]|uniref:hypothetical protein n=1 Tax=Curtobacterium sp. MCBD17_040 TaxID=2175674 RepID=UPI0011B7CF36|nr:hypothetical protein [Curtobacterium sp. MCBD17_040]WIB65704.1 hypothetical protein DEI94_16415 [Curtobacterium sp. MCBD17_040]